MLLLGDTATGKSESLEALRLAGEDRIRELRVIADDMGSLEVGEDGAVRAYGTEIGAFVRLDDLQQGYAFGQMDRAIIMSPQRVNARVVLPVTTLEEVLQRLPGRLPALRQQLRAGRRRASRSSRSSTTSEQALRVFREGAALSKGTTTSTGLTSCYFANIFGPAQRVEAHDELARTHLRGRLRGGRLRRPAAHAPRHRRLRERGPP